jgi:hypothetical protein
MDGCRDRCDEADRRESSLVHKLLRQLNIIIASLLQGFV